VCFQGRGGVRDARSRRHWVAGFVAISVRKIEPVLECEVKMLFKV
jgi:hypothetical protein